MRFAYCSTVCLCLLLQRCVMGTFITHTKRLIFNQFLWSKLFYYFCCSLTSSVLYTWTYQNKSINTDLPELCHLDYFLVLVGVKCVEQWLRNVSVQDWVISLSGFCWQATSSVTQINVLFVLKQFGVIEKEIFKQAFPGSIMLFPLRD